MTSVTKRNLEKNKYDKEKSKAKVNDKSLENEKPGKEPKFGPLPRFPGQRIWSRGIMIFGIMIYIWYSSKTSKETALANQKEIYNKRGQNVECSAEFLDDIKAYTGCTPTKCGRFVSDKIITSHEADTLLSLTQRVMAMGGSSGGATVWDLNSGALSFKDKFINAFAIKDSKLFTPTEKTMYSLVKSKIQHAIADTFGIDEKVLHLTYPLFFSRLTSAEPKIPNDEYWHPHIDKLTYEAFHYTSLIYLNDYGKDFKGGRFIFMNDINKSTKNVTVEPRKGRVSMFTSGSENPHFVERVTEGVRFAMTVPFTCNPSKRFKNSELE